MSNPEDEIIARAELIADIENQKINLENQMLHSKETARVLSYIGLGSFVIGCTTLAIEADGNIEMALNVYGAISFTASFIGLTLALQTAREFFQQAVEYEQLRD